MMKLIDLGTVGSLARAMPSRLAKFPAFPLAIADRDWRLCRRVAAAALAVLVLPICSQHAIADDSEELAKKLNNPVSDLISFPIQSNFDFNIGPDDDGWRMTTNVQPVVPIHLNKEWNLISRTIVPIVYQDDVPAKSFGSKFGLSDTVQSLFLSPQAPVQTSIGNLIWGVGPAALIPTSTDRFLGSGTFGLGPTGVALFQDGPWTYGALVNHLWGVARTRSHTPDLSNTYMQPFLVYTTPSAWSFAVNTELSYDWKTDGKKLSGPVNFTVSKLVRIGEQPVSLQAGVRWWAFDTPSSPQGLGFRLNATFLFPS